MKLHNFLIDRSKFQKSNILVDNDYQLISKLSNLFDHMQTPTFLL